MKGLFFAAMLVMSGFAHAEGYGSLYGSQNENTYSNTGHGYQGYNSGTGANWNAQSSGNITTGTDSKGNSWTYDRSSGSYYNYGTGESRSHGVRNR